MVASGETILDFIAACEPKNQGQLVLYAGYYLEVTRNLGSFTGPDIAGALLEARAPNAPKNVSVVAGRLVRAEQLIVLEPGPPRRYALSQPALEAVTKKLNEIGWFTSTPEEPTRIIREISETLHARVLTITDADERGYIEEALACLHPTVNAHRAAIVMGWAATMFNLRRKIERTGLPAFNAEFQRRFPKARKRPVSVIDDFEEYGDAEILGVAEGMNVISKAVHKALKQHLDIRNNCGHPTDYQPGIHRVKTFFEEVINYVLAVP